jgi:hypothetical protein
MSKPTNKQSSKPAITYVAVPAPLMLAAEKCAGADEARPYLSGVFIHAVEKDLRIVATDGSMLFVSTLTDAAPANAPKWLSDGIIVDRTNLPAMVKMAEKLNGDNRLVLGHDGANARCTLSDSSKLATFRPAVVDGVFPEYQRIMPASELFEARGRVDFENVAYDPAVLRRATDVAKLLSGKEMHHMRLFASPDSPNVITFDYPGTMLIVMPIRNVEAFAPATARLLAPAVTSSVAALKAHMTRAKQAGNMKKVEEYEARIEAIMKNFGPAQVEHKPANGKKGASKDAAKQPEGGEAVKGEAPAEAPAAAPAESTEKPAPTVEKPAKGTTKEPAPAEKPVEGSKPAGEAEKPAAPEKPTEADKPAAKANGSSNGNGRQSRREARKLARAGAKSAAKVG